MKQTIHFPEQMSLESYGKFTNTYLNKILNNLPKRPRGYSKLILDLQSTKWVSPTGLTIMRSYIEEAKNLGIGIEVKLPRKQIVSNFIESMNLFEEDIGWFTTSDNYCSLVEVDYSNMNTAVDKLKSILNQQFSLDQEHIDAFDYTVSELLQNIFQHSEKESGYIAAMKQSSKNRLEISIVDRGIGVKESLIKNDQYKRKATSDETALSLACKSEVTCNPTDNPTKNGEGNSGEGLFWATEFIKENNGQFLIHSGNGQLCINEERTITKKLDNFYWHGTIVCLVFNLDNKIKMKDVYDQFDEQYQDTNYDIINTI